MTGPRCDLIWVLNNFFGSVVDSVSQRSASLSDSSYIITQYAAYIENAPPDEVKSRLIAAGSSCWKFSNKKTRYFWHNLKLLTVENC